MNKFKQTLADLQLSKEAAAVILGASFLTVRSWVSGVRRPKQEAETIAKLERLAPKFKAAMERIHAA